MLTTGAADIPLYEAPCQLPNTLLHTPGGQLIVSSLPNGMGASQLKLLSSMIWLTDVRYRSASWRNEGPLVHATLTGPAHGGGR